MTTLFDEGLLAVLDYFRPEAIIVRYSAQSGTSKPIDSLIFAHKGGNSGCYRLSRVALTGQFIEDCRTPFRRREQALLAANAASSARHHALRIWRTPDEG